MSNSYSYGSSNSSDGSFIPNYPQADLLNQFASMASQFGQQTYNWAQQQFAKGSAVTDNVVGNYLDASSMAKSLARNNLDRYTGEFQPMEDQLVHDANTYSSDARVRSEMGAAESGVGQSFDAARQNSEQQLQSFGIDPSSGRYAELEHADATKRAAAQAGAGQAARYNTENTGRQLRQQAISVGQQYPAQIANTLNAQANDLAGAQNAILGNENTGANMFNAANGFMGTAMRLPYPPLGRNGTSSSSNQSRSNTPNRQTPSGSGSSSGGPGGGSGGRGPSGDYSSDPNTDAYTGRSSYGGQPNPSFINVPGGGTTPPDIVDPGSTGGDWTDSGGWTSAGQPDPWATQDGTDPGMGWGTGDGSTVGGTSGWGNWNGQDPWANQSAGQQVDQWGGTDTYANSPSPFGADTNNYDSSAFDSYNQGGGFGADDSGGGDWSSYDFAAGGAIPDQGPTTGGFVDQSLSPSQGQQTDDIPANLNANEFVIPRDVALWKGQEFFQKLIDQSRKARGGAPAQGKPAPAAQGTPRFTSGAAQ